MNRPEPARPAAMPASKAAMMAVVLGAALAAVGPVSAAAMGDTIQHMSRYCAACWRNARLPADAWPDCTQEVFTRLMERMPTEQWPRSLGEDGDERREFVRAIDTVKKRHQRAKRWATLPDQLAGPAGDQVAEQVQSVEVAAVELLSERQREIVRLSFEGRDVAEIAERLGTTAARVSDEKYKAIRKLRAHFAERGEVA